MSTSTLHLEIVSEFALWQMVLGKTAALLDPASLYLLNSLHHSLDIALLTKVSFRQANKIAAVLELARRLKSNQHSTKRVLNSPFNAYMHFKDMAGLEQEVIRAAYLDSQLQVIHDQVIAIGSLNKAHAQLREILRPAFLANAHTFILAHNHPSGDFTPSEEDFQFTKQVAAIANCLGIPLQDHIVIANTGFKSLRQIRNDCFE